MASALTITRTAAIICLAVAVGTGWGAGFMFGANRVDEDRAAAVDDAWKGGVKLGAICAHHPDLAACAPGELDSYEGGVP